MDIQVSQATELLERTPSVLHAFLAGLPEPWVTRNEGPETFSARDVVGHLIHGEETDWVPRIRIILEEGDQRPFTPFDRFGFKTKIEGRPLPDLLARFEKLRNESLSYVRGLGLEPSQLEKKGKHPELGGVTLGQLIATWVVHDLNHLSQIARVMAKQYDEAVGPWKAYLSILTR